MAGKHNELLRRWTRTLTTIALVVFLLLLAGLKKAERLKMVM